VREYAQWDWRGTKWPHSGGTARPGVERPECGSAEPRKARFFAEYRKFACKKCALIIIGLMTGMVGSNLVKLVRDML
jgi:hypothetical protein